MTTRAVLLIGAVLISMFAPPQTVLALLARLSDRGGEALPAVVNGRTALECVAARGRSPKGRALLDAGAEPS